MVTGDMVEEVLKFKRLDGPIPALRDVAVANFQSNTQRISLRELFAYAKRTRHSNRIG
jgi:hypothetical protein